MQNFKIRPYQKRVLARLYFPDTGNERSAVANMRNMIHRCRPLADALEEAGYQPRRKWFTPREVQLIVRYAGEP